MTSLNAPLSYVTPPFPSLYWPIGANASTPQYLYTLEDIWRFVLTWTLVTVGAAHLVVALWATLCQFLSAYRLSTYLKSPAGQALSAKNRKLLGEKPLRETAGWVWGIFVVYIVMGGIEALMAGSIVGLVLGAVYNAGYFKMATWTPLAWGIVNMLVLVVSSFRVQGGL